MRRPLADPRGLALPLTLMTLMLLSTLSLALLSMSAFEPLISANLADTERARFVAEAGIEWAFSTLRESADWDSFLAGADPSRGTMLIADRPLPGQSASGGTFTVRVRNDALPGDPRSTGVPPDAGGPTRDTNGHLVLTAVGRAGRASQAIQAVVRRVELPPVPAALAFSGSRAPLAVSGDFETDGNDQNPDGNAGSCAPVFGVSVSAALPESAPGANEALVESVLAGHPPASVKGKRQDPAGPSTGANTIAPAPALTPSEVQSFIGAVKQADVTVSELGVSLSDIGAGCAADWWSSTCWGTRERPKVIRVKGSPDPASPGRALRLSGSTEGHGILIVEDAEVWISGGFLWHGPIIATGNRVTMGFLGGGEETVYGAVIFNHISPDAEPGRGFVTGSVRLRFSCQALDQARRARKLATLKSWKETGQP